MSEDIRQQVGNQEVAQELTVKENEKRTKLQVWIQEFIDSEVIFTRDGGETPSGSGTPISLGKIHKVPNLLKRHQENEEDCFTPQAFPIGLHNLINCFDASKLKFKVKVAKAFSVYIFPGESQSRRWQSLVRAIVGHSVEEHRSVSSAYEDFDFWGDRQTLSHWHFAFLLAVDAVFLVTCIQTRIPKEEKKECFDDSQPIIELIKEKEKKECFTDSQPLKELIKEKGQEISIFLKWDLSLIENQVPLKLLQEVINLQVKKETELQHELDLLVKYAVWLSYPFFPNVLGSDDCCLNCLGCCCPWTPHDFIFSEDIEGGNTSNTRTVEWSFGNDFVTFGQHWEKIYSGKFTSNNYHHLLDCTHRVTGWLLPASDSPNPTNNSILQIPGAGSLLTSSRSQPRVTFPRLLSNLLQPFMHKVISWCRDPCTRMSRRNGSEGNQRPNIVWNEDRILSATELGQAGVRIKGLATRLSSISFVTINFWTVLTSLCFYLSCLPCCFECSCCSCISRWRGSLVLPRVKMYKETKRLLRNLALFEQLAHPGSVHVRNYVKIMRCLAHKEEDAQLLIRSGVIQSHLAAAVDVVNTWRYIDDGLDAVPLAGPWVNIYRDLHEHLNNRCKKWYARFWISNCSNPMVACSFVIVFVIFVTSMVRTYLSIVRSTADHLWWP